MESDICRKGSVSAVSASFSCLALSELSAASCDVSSNTCESLLRNAITRGILKNPIIENSPAKASPRFAS
jgi:hypothetical protein